MASEQDLAVAQIVSALIAKGFDKDTDGFDVRFEDNVITLVDTNGHTMSLRALIHQVRSGLQ